MKKIFIKQSYTTLAFLTFLFVFASPVYAKNPHTIPVPTPTPPPPISITAPVLWGAYTGNSDSTMASFELYIGKKMSLDAMFWGWNEVFPSTTAGTQGKTLVVYWEPSFGYDQINNGSQDAYIAQFAQGAKNYGYPVVLAPFDEFNLNESAWGNSVNGNTPQSFIDAWRRVRNIFNANQATNVKFALVYNNVSIPSASYASFYPGSSYVDYVGVDGFNFGAQTFADVFAKALPEANSFGKPVWIFSTGSVAPKSQFILDLGASGYPWIWFNQSPFEIDTSSLSAFQTIL